MAQREYTEKKGRLAEMLKSKQIQTPIQEVRPIESQAITSKTDSSVAGEKKKEVHVNFWLDATVMQRLRLHALQSGKSIKQVCREALEAYLPD